MKEVTNTILALIMFTFVFFAGYAYGLNKSKGPAYQESVYDACFRVQRFIKLEEKDAGDETILPDLLKIRCERLVDE